MNTDDTFARTRLELVLFKLYHLNMGGAVRAVPAHQVIFFIMMVMMALTGTPLR